MANHVSHAALPYPVKHARFTVAVPYLDADGDPTDPTTPDTEFSLDAGAFADCAEEVTTISGSDGCGYLTITGAETNGSVLALAFKVASGPKATLMTLYPRVLPILESGTAQTGAAGTITLASGAAAFDLTGCIVRTTGGTGGGGTGGANNQARTITAYNTSTKVATIEPNWETNPSSDTTYDILFTEVAANAIAGRYVRPTTDGRTMDVSSGGEAGVDWANVGSPTTTLNLSGTSTKALEPTTAGRTLDVAFTGEAGLDFDNIKDATGAHTLTNITVPTTTTAGSVTGAVGSVTGNVGGNVTGSVGSVATGGIAAASFAAGAIDAAAIATDAIGSAELAASAVTEIQSGLALDSTVAKEATLSTVAGYVDTEVAAIKAKTDNLPASPAAVGSAMTLANGAIIAATFGAGAIDAAAIAADAIGSSELAASAVTEIQTGLSTLTTGDVATATQTGMTSQGYTTARAGYLDTLNGLVAAIWNTLTSALTTAGSIGKLLVDNLNATVSSRMATFTYTAPDNTSITGIKAKTDNLPGSPAAVGSAMTLAANAITSTVLDSTAGDELAASLLDLAAGVETGLTLRQALRLMVAADAGKLSGAATTTIVIRSVGDTKDRITASVTGDGDRTAVTYDLT